MNGLVYEEKHTYDLFDDEIKIKLTWNDEKQKYDTFDICNCTRQGSLRLHTPACRAGIEFAGAGCFCHL